MLDVVDKKPKIAFWFRYGPAEHTELLHALPDIIEGLAAETEVHYFSLSTDKEIPQRILDHAKLHRLPFSVNRHSGRDKMIKGILWIFCLPFIALRSRLMGITCVYIDETVPLSAVIAKLFFGRKVAVTVVDFFPEIFLGGNPLLTPLVKLIRALDLWAWRRLPLMFTRAKSTKNWLVEMGVPEERVHAVYDPCDFGIYYPADKAAARKRFGYGEDEVILVHHGILHSNKGNDRILRIIAEMRAEYPNIRYLLVGDGPEMENLKALSKELALDDLVQLTGWLPEMTDVNQALNAGDVGLMMRVGMKEDNFHMTGALIHAMACGLPILSARLRGPEEIITDGDSGYLFDPDDMDEFKARFAELIVDRALRERLGAKAHELAKDAFDMENVTRRQIEPLVELAKE